MLTLDQLRDKLSEMANHEPHLGLDPTAASSEDPTISLETEKFLLGQKVRTIRGKEEDTSYLKGVIFQFKYFGTVSVLQRILLVVR